MKTFILKQVGSLAKRYSMYFAGAIVTAGVTWLAQHSVEAAGAIDQAKLTGAVALIIAGLIDRLLINPVLEENKKTQEVINEELDPNKIPIKVDQWTGPETREAIRTISQQYPKKRKGPTHSRPSK